MIGQAALIVLGTLGIAAVWVALAALWVLFFHGANLAERRDRALLTPPTDDEPDIGVLDDDDEGDGGYRHG